MLETESDNSVEDSDVEISNEETLRLPILDREKPSTSIELKKLVADGKLDMDDKSKDDILKDYNLFSKGVKCLVQLMIRRCQR